LFDLNKVVSTIGLSVGISHRYIPTCVKSMRQEIACTSGALIDTKTETQSGGRRRPLTARPKPVKASKAECVSSCAHRHFDARGYPVRPVSP
jgi:hypothetical protein